MFTICVKDVLNCIQILNYFKGIHKWMCYNIVINTIVNSEALINYYIQMVKKNAVFVKNHN